MRGLAADISDQTCKTAAQSRTRFVGHRQLPWIHLSAPVSLRLGDRRVGKGVLHAVPTNTCESIAVGTLRFAHPTVLTSIRAPFALALDHFGRKLEIGLAADAFGIVYQHRLAAGRGFGDPPLAPPHGLFDLPSPQFLTPHNTLLT